jgi:hypothetical protein
MSTAQQLPPDPANKAQVRTAFLLGWAVSQTLGHLRKGARPSQKASTRPADYAPRLVVADGVAEKSTDAFVLAAQRVVQFYRALGFEATDLASPLTETVDRLPQALSAWLAGESTQFYSPHELRELLNSWSLQVWARLGGDSVDGLRAFTAGMSLADTFWYLRLPTRRPKGSKPGELSDENWRRLLSKYRLDTERSRLRSLEGHLPAYAAAVISRHLEAWRVGTELGYRDGKFVRIKDGKETGALQPNDEARLQQALARQVQNWEAMVFGSREATTFLQSRDRRRIRIGHTLGLVLSLILFSLILASALAGIGYFFVGVLTVVVPALLRKLPNLQVSVSDLVAIGNLLWTVLVGLNLPLLIRLAYQPARAAQKWIDDQLTIYYIARRTYVPWDQYVKQKSVVEGQ